MENMLTQGELFQRLEQRPFRTCEVVEVEVAVDMTAVAVAAVMTAARVVAVEAAAVAVDRLTGTTVTAISKKRDSSQGLLRARQFSV
jgi:hypothetical protein